MSYYKLKCHNCGAKNFTIEVLPYSTDLFAICGWCNNCFLFGLDYKFPTNDNEYVKRKAILFRRFT